MTELMEQERAERWGQAPMDNYLPQREGSLLNSQFLDVGEATHDSTNCLSRGSTLYPGAGNGVNDLLLSGGTRSYRGPVKDGGYADAMATTFRRSNAHGIVMSNLDYVRTDAVDVNGQVSQSESDSVGYRLAFYHQRSGQAAEMLTGIYIQPISRAIASMFHQVAALQLYEGKPVEAIIVEMKVFAERIGVPWKDMEKTENQPS